MSTEAEIVNVLKLLARTYPKFELKQETIEAYVMFLADIPIDQLRAGAAHCVTSNTFFPSVHEIRKSIAEIRRKADGIPTAAEAWEDLITISNRRTYTPALDQFGYSVVRCEYHWRHPIVRRVAEMLGWPRTFPTDNPVADRAHWNKAYEEAVNGVISDAQMLPQVREYIDRARSLGPGNEIKQLAERMHK